MLKKLAQKRFLILAAIFCALVVSAILVGVSDNMPGIVLCYLATTIPVIALTYTWQEVKKFLLIMGISAGAFIVSVFLHNAISALFDIEEPVFFIMAIFVCPIGFLVGAVGSIVLTIKKSRIAKKSPSSPQ